jgi:hypothetical protein
MTMINEASQRAPKAAIWRRGDAQTQARRSGGPFARRAARLGAEAM